MFDDGDFLIDVTVQRRTKASDELVKEVIEFVKDHDFVRTSPCHQDTLKIDG